MTKFSRYYRLMIILITILVIIPATCFAYDNNSTVANDNLIISTNQNEIYVSLSGNDSNDGTINNPKATLDGDNGAINYANNYNITTIILDNGTFHFEDISINKNNYNLNNLIIKGSGSTIISATDFNIFNIGVENINSNPMNVTFLNIDFTNSNYYNPAILCFHSYLTIINCNFYNNGGYTACIGSYYNSLTRIYNSKFYDNRNCVNVIENSAGSYCSFNILDNIMIIENCQFFNNSGDSGIVVNIADSTINAIMIIINSNFTNNYVTLGGGAIYNTDLSSFINCSSTLDIYDCFFGNNKVETSGGAIYCSGNYVLKVYDSIFKNNSALLGLSISNSGTGGALYLAGGSAKIYNSSFYLNNASRGGAIFNTFSNDIIIVNSTFKENNAEMGGAIYMDLPRDYGQYSKFDNLTFEDNTAKVGDAIFTNDLNMDKGHYLYFNCSKSNFTNNSVYNVGNLGLYDNNFSNSDIINTGNLALNNNLYINSSVTNITGNMDIKFLANVSGYYGETVKIKANVTGDIPNNIIIFCIGIYEYLAVYNETSGLYEYDFKINSGNDASVSAYSLMDNDCTSNKITVSVLKLPVNLTLNIPNIAVGDNLKIEVYLSSNNIPITASITVSINNKNYNVFVQNGHGIGSFSNNLVIGNYTAYASYGKNNIKYEYVNVIENFYVFKGIPIDTLDGAVININNISAYYSQDVIISATITKNNILASYTKTLQFKINNQIINATFNNDNDYYEAHWVVNQNDAIITVNTNDSAIIFKGIFKLLKYSTNLDLNIPDIIFNKSSLIVYLNLTSNSKNIDGIVKLNINNTIYYVNVVNGKAQYTISDLVIGNYIAIATYNGTDYYSSATKTTNFNVLINPRTVFLISNNTELYYKNGTPFVVLLLDCNKNPIVGVNIIIKINGVGYSHTTNNEGKSSMSINLLPGIYVLDVEFKGNENYDSCSSVSTVTVLSIIQGRNIELYFRNGTSYEAKFLKGDGSPLGGAQVKFNINGVFYTKTTNANGIARLTINLNPGTYIITAIIPNYFQYSNTIKVLHTLEAKDLFMHYKDGSKFKVKVLNGKGDIVSGATIRFNVNGIFYTKTTGLDGIASLTINLIPGKYIISSYWGYEIISNIITIV